VAVFGFTLSQANRHRGLGLVADGVLAVGCGWLSDRLVVRKPVIVGALRSLWQRSCCSPQVGTHSRYGS